jgi:hypothetical protein
MENKNSDTLCHYGILGMKWGVRRYQNKDGSLTPAGKKRADKMKDEYTKLTGKRLIRKPIKKSDQQEDITKKRIKDMSDTEIKDRITRLENEKRLSGLQRDTASTGQKVATAAVRDVLAPAAISAGKQLLTNWLMKYGEKKLGLNAGETKDALADLRKEVDELELQKRKTIAEDYFTKRNEKTKTSNEKKEKVKVEYVKPEQTRNNSEEKSDSKKTVVKEAIYEEVGKSTVNRYNTLLLPPPMYRKDK